MRVESGGEADGASVSEAGLRQLQGVFLVEIERDGRSIAPVGPDERLQGGDLLTFVGRVDNIVDLQRVRGLASTEARQIGSLAGNVHAFYEVVVGAGGDLVGQTLKQVDFRARYDAAVIAIHRAGQRVDAKLGDVPLRVGDTLLVLVRPRLPRSVARSPGLPGHRAAVGHLATSAAARLADRRRVPRLHSGDRLRPGPHPPGLDRRGADRHRHRGAHPAPGSRCGGPADHHHDCRGVRARRGGVVQRIGRHDRRRPGERDVAAGRRSVRWPRS